MGLGKLNIFSYNKLQIHNSDAKSRNKNIYRQFTVATFLKFLSIGLNFLLLPLMLKALGEERFGVWVTLLSITSWIAMMDIGIGNGLRNKLSESFAVNNKENSKRLVSTAYIILSGIIAVLILLAIVLIYLLDWQKIFNSTAIAEIDLKYTVMIVFIAIALNFVLSLANQIINALQRNSLTTLSTIIANLLMLAALFIFSHQLKNNIELMAIIYSVTLLFSIGFISVFLFKEYAELIPRFKYYDKSVVKDILNVGVKFFIIQIAGVIIFTTDNFIIAQTLGPAEVSGYNVTLKVYNAFVMFFGLIMAPFWSAYTEAYVKKEFSWIKSRIKLQNKLMIVLVAIIALLTFLFQPILNLWIDTPVNIPAYLPALGGIFAILSIWNNIYGFVLGGINKIRLGAIVTVFTASINIPLAIYFAKHTDLGSGGVLISTIICLSVTALISPLQVYYFIYMERKSKFLDKLLS
ncbi:MATE family efflux transporter [Pedobacter metabolipauper]|uniref:Na+-driven multidrug efflux pump n=1 Tax=Pedobacter metabolipauper TaxID=425513 RepID=A0A4R6SVX1_9SPHI|nr:MATE family efflux transporter [Pedobacter metabolipauper]TDQ09960.1 Na+-driven multidrug efflux pump [Pedobacter metabolipauper]